MLSSSPYYPLWSFAPFGPLAVAYTFAQHAWIAFHQRILGRTVPPLGNSDQAPLSIAPSSTRELDGKIAIVTGSNTGIGFETAKALVVDHGMTVILACRSRDKAELAAKQINDANGKSGGKAIFLHPLDLSSFQSVRHFSAQVKEYCQKQQQQGTAAASSIQVLVNNAGRNTSGPSNEKYNQDQPLDLLYQSNMLGHYLLTAELLLIMTPGARIVNLSSVMHHFCGGSHDNLESVDFWRNCALHGRAPHDPYSPSKLAALLFSIELNRRFGGGKELKQQQQPTPRIRSIAVNPGAVNSDIWRDFPRFIVLLFNLVYINNQQGCQTSVAAAVSDAVDDDDKAIYLQPYPVVWNPQQPAFPAYEMLAPFAGPLVTRPRLPTQDEGARAAAAFWQASQEITGAQWQSE